MKPVHVLLQYVEIYPGCVQQHTTFMVKFNVITTLTYFSVTCKKPELQIYPKGIPLFSSTTAVKMDTARKAELR